MGEAEARMASEAILSGWITTGPKTKEFERQLAAYCHTQRVACLSSSTASMEMALHLIGVGPGDEVIVPAYTYTASCSVICHVGATPVMVDSQPDSVEMDYDLLAEAITPRTKVVLPVDLAGVVCDYDRIYAAVESKRHLFRAANALQQAFGRVIVLADAAHALGAVWHGRRAGEIADFSAFSFHAVKNLTTAEGGALTWHLPFGEEPAVMDADTTVPAIVGESWNELLYRKCQLYSLHGQNKDALAKTQLGAWEYDVIGPWYKCNMTDIMAGIGLAQLERYDAMLQRRQEIVARYNAAIDDLNQHLDEAHRIAYLNHKGAEHCSSHHLYLVRLRGRSREETNAVIVRMAEQGISLNVHYKPLPMMTAYRNMGFDIKDYPNAYALFENEVTLPLYSRLTDEEVEYIIKNFVLNV